MSRAANFDPVARIYRFAEYLSLGPLLQRTRTHFLPQLDGCRNALILGDGDGRFLAALLRRNTRVRATAFDTSAKMLELLRRRCAFANSRLMTRRRSLLRITSAPRADLIVTHFVLDCFTQAEVNRIVFNLSTSKPGALWLLSDFGLPRTEALRPFARLYIRALYLAFAALTGLEVRTLPDPQKPLQLSGFERLARHERLNGLLYTELWRNNAHSSPDIHLEMSDATTHPPFDAQPDPEPAAPSLPEPDPEVYHHDVGIAPKTEPSEPNTA